MKRRRKMIIAGVIFVALLGIGWWYLFMGCRITDGSSEIIDGEDGTRSLVVYFSRFGEIPDTVDAMAAATPNSNQDMDGSDTEAAAKMIQELTGADLYQIRTERYYRSAFWGTAAMAWIEETLNLRPGLAAQPENLDNYDVIYVGYPIWWFNAPMAIGSFLESYDLTGKTVVPFCTSSDNGIDVSMDYIREVSEGATVLDGYRVHNSGLEDVAGWLTRIGMLEQTDGTDVADSEQTEPKEIENSTSRKKALLALLQKERKNTGALSSTMCSILSVRAISITMSTFLKAMTAANPMRCTLPCRATKDCIFRELLQTYSLRNSDLKPRNIMTR